jgi:hypothetical protein
MVVRRMPQRSIWLMLTNEVPESKIAGVLQIFFSDLDKGKPQKDSLNSFGDFFSDQISIMTLII